MKVGCLVNNFTHLDKRCANDKRFAHPTLAGETTTLYRVYGGGAREIGPYWTRIEPSGPVQSIIDSALDPRWGNNATRVVRIDVPRGTTIYEGTAAAQRGLVGGGNQVFIQTVEKAWIVK